MKLLLANIVTIVSLIISAITLLAGSEHWWWYLIFAALMAVTVGDSKDKEE